MGRTTTRFRPTYLKHANPPARNCLRLDGNGQSWRAEAGGRTGQESRSTGRRAATSVTAMEITIPATSAIRPSVATTSVSPNPPGRRDPRLQGVTMTGSTTQGITTVLHPVADLAAAKAVYSALLGTPPQTDGSYYVGFEAAGQQIGLVPGGGPQGMTSPVAYWQVADIEAKLAEVTAAGATLKEPA